MRPDDLRLWLQERIFRPFRIHLTNGKVYEIRQAEQVLVERTVALITPPLLAGDEGAFPQRPATVALLHIVYLEPITSSPTPSSN